MKIAILAAAAALSMAVPTPDLGPITEGAAVHADSGKHDNRHQRYKHYQRQQAREYRQEQRYYDRQARRDARHDRRLGRNDRIWRGNDGRYRCRRDDGTAGLVIGGALGAIGGAEIAGRRDRTIGAIIGAVGGGLLGRELDRGGVTCR
ncbi:glycine zipper 2TM domain-containing protein [Novosphingopyxis sp.]|uniref:glycine zipper 2TM domain-containing protein n=1 Tax=Novosphingopyxis sp. TaxID=2709690 RepID=UPI003B5CECFB